MQEDEADLIKRKAKAEEDEVDIDTITTADGPYQKNRSELLEVDDEDNAWADEEPDDDGESFKMKIIMEEDVDM